MYKELTQMMEQIYDLTVLNNHYFFTFIVCTFNIQKVERGLVWLVRHFAYGRSEITCIHHVKIT